MQQILKVAFFSLMLVGMASLPVTAAAQDEGDAGPGQDPPPIEGGQEDEATGEADSDAPTEPAEPVAPETLDPLLEEFKTIAADLRKQGRVLPTDYQRINGLRERVTAFNMQREPGDESMAIELQLVLWGSEYGQPLKDVIQRLDAFNPQAPGLRLMLAEQLRQQGRFDRTVELIDATDNLDLSRYPIAAVIRAEALIPLNRFGEAAAALESIPPGAIRTADLLDRIYFIRQRIDSFAEAWSTEQATLAAEAQADDLPRVSLTTERGEIVLELFENEAPNTVANFISLIEKDFYDGVTFHRVEPGYVIQGGDPSTRPVEEGAEPAAIPQRPGTGGPGYRIEDEIPEETYRRHWAGYLSMAHAGPDTGGSQFFITLGQAEHLDGVHTVFGRVIEGMDVVRSIEIGDRITDAAVLRKRDHEYVPVTIPIEEPPVVTPPAEEVGDEGVVNDGEIDDTEAEGDADDGGR